MRVRSLITTLLPALSLALFLCASPALAQEDEPPAASPWQVRLIPTPLKTLTPSFIAADGHLIAWTGASLGLSSTSVFDLTTGRNTLIPTNPPGSYFNPSLSGGKVVFQGGRAGAFSDIYVYDVQSRSLDQLTSNDAPGDGHDWSPRVQDNRVVWEKNMLGTAAKPGIYLHDLVTGTTSLLLEGDDYRDPDIWGDYVVCVKNVSTGNSRGPASEVWLLNLRTKQAPLSIADRTRSNEHPRVADGKVVWSSGTPWAQGLPDPWPSNQIHLYDIDTATVTVLTNNVAGNLNPAIGEGLVAWETRQPSSVMVYDLATSSTTQLPLQPDEAHAPEIAPFGVVWFGRAGLYTAVPPDEATRFPDVPRMHVYHKDIESMAEAKIIEGYATGYFGPEDLVTRQQFAKMIVLSRGLVATLQDEYQFTDAKDILRVQGELFAYHYVARAALSGLIKGYTDGSFRPKTNISREQVVTMIVRASSTVLQPPPSNWSGVLSYADPTHGQNIRVAEYNGLLEGIVGPGQGLSGWNTKEKANRGECAQILWNMRLRLQL